MQLTSGFLWVLYGSVFEWYWHRYWMHQLRHPKEAFRGHAVVHHGLYRGDDSYFVTEEHVEHILLKPYALPAIFLMHLPVVWLIDRYLVANTAIGAMTACVLYFVIYEYMHYNMHVPRGHWVERFRWFQFLRQHHKLHHKYQQKNFCVLFPLADWVLGTMVTDASLARQKAEREAALAQGISIQDLKQRRKRVKGRA
jgi:sterol desaturase/sphingolipid hydroxylase (fatty acid hydroxylase superfamily)